MVYISNKDKHFNLCSFRDYRKNELKAAKESQHEFEENIYRQN